MPLESTITAAIKRRAESLGWYVVKIHGGRYQASGLPDLLCLRGGRAAWLEVKQPGKKPTKLQERRIAELRRAGCFAVVATSVATAELALQVAARTSNIVFSDGRHLREYAVRLPDGVEVR